ncbi:MAG: hypothetical protein EOO11_05655 [Chitinophagaceae bacterium]|nr:MAG: hypothetical protein EOO11_05655 [Chitinophagaceae bacterium]
MLSLLFIGFPAEADCACDQVSIYPNSDTLKRNSLIVLVSTFCPDKTDNFLLHLNRRFPVYLQADEERIKLVVQQTFRSTLNVIQVVLKPERLPAAGKSYTIHIDGVGRFQSPHRMNLKNADLEPAAFTFTAEQDLQGPSVLTVPTQIGTYSRYEACGPSSLVLFTYPARDKSSVFVKTTVRSLKTGKEETILLFPRERDGLAVLEVGYYRCDVGFPLKGEEDYQVRFVFQDICGNFSSGPDRGIRFRSPKTPEY